MRILLVLGAMVSLGSCGGGGAVSGDIGQACQDGGRRDASPQLCTCVQQVANQTLSKREQSRAVAFFDDPQLAQDTRQSDRSSDEAFWQRYKSFTELASEICQPIEI
ncbi:arginine transporter [Loktanella agnita]|uniref:arginine transporter n=1 Tax=Loktanella agnita TaxID=287097 RepID=UPI003987548A